MTMLFLQCLRAANSSDIVHNEYEGVAVGLNAFPFVPIVDGEFLPYSPSSILASGKYPRKEILLGVVKEEAIYFLIYYLMDLLKLTENVSMSRFRNS